MKNLFLGLLFVLACSVSFAAGPEKDGPFPKRMAGFWTSQNSSMKVYIRVGSLGDGRYQVFVVLKDNHGKTVALGSTVIEEDAVSARVTMSFKGHTEIMVIRLIAYDGDSGHLPFLQVSLGASTEVFYKLP